MNLSPLKVFTALSLLSFCCGCAKGVGAANTGLEAKGGNSHACEIAPEKNVTLQPTEGRVVDLSGKTVLVNPEKLETYGLNLKDPDAYLCGHMKDWQAEEPEEILVIGNQDGLTDFDDHIRFLIKSWNLSAAGSHRRGCLFVLSKKNLDRIAQRKNVERIVFLGHGSEGNLLTPSGDTITPESLPPMASTSIKEVHFFSCQAGQKEDVWRKVFAASSSQLDLSRDNIAVVDSLNELGKIMEQIWMCHL